MDRNYVCMKISEYPLGYIRGDGNCFYRAISKVINGTENRHQELRHVSVDFINDIDRFKQFIDGSPDDHIIRMYRIGTWETQVEIYAMATMLQRNIYVLSPCEGVDDNDYRWLLFKPQFAYTITFTDDKCYITLSHTNGNQYDRITVKDKFAIVPCSRRC